MCGEVQRSKWLISNVSSRKTTRTIDIVVARQVIENFSPSETACNENKNLEEDDIESQQPLSLLALHDEEDLINLSSTPLRPSIQDSNIQLQKEEKVFRFRCTKLKILILAYNIFE